jgi:prepilin-type N-terminal cleavage/methylation domain-containing protein
MTHGRLCLPRSPGPRSRGFSLVELIAVTIIAAILAVVAIPSYAAVTASRTAYATRQIIRDIGYARERAVATGTRTWVVFNVGLNRYSILAENPSSPGRSGAIALADPANTAATYLQILGTAQYSGVTLGAVNFDGGNEVGFDWLGGPLNSSETALAAQGTVSLNGGYSVTVQPLTGLAR